MGCAHSQYQRQDIINVLTDIDAILEQTKRYVIQDMAKEKAYRETLYRDLEIL